MSVHPLNQVYPTPFLPEHELKGWVTIEDHVIKINWKPKESLSISSTYKALCECVSAEAALLKGETEVIIR
jgi:ssDNA-specific exonuclease RecJ